MPYLPPPVPSIEFSIASTGMSKGIAQTEGAQFLGRGELAFGKVVLGAYAKNVTSSSAEGEGGLSAGIRTSAAGLDLAASATWKRAIDPAPGSNKNGLELSGSVTRKVGRVTPRLSLVWSPDDVGLTGRTLFVEAGAAYKPAKAWTASVGLGRRERAGGADYTAWNAGLAWNPAKPVAIDLRYYDTDGGGARPFKARLVLTGRVRL